MSGRPSTGWVEVAGIPYLRMVGVATRLDVTKTQVDTWWTRRARNGFPGGMVVEVDGRRLRVWDPAEVDSWRAGYRPSRGGAPTGARNGSWRGGSRRRVDEDGTRRRAS